MESGLKVTGKATLSAILVANVFACASLVLGLYVADFGTYAASATPFALLGIASGALNQMVSHEVKDRVVYWRWRDALPARNAFSTLGPADARVDMAVIKKLVGSVPRSPRHQVRSWYRLYRAVKTDPSVMEADRSYVLYRDCTTLALMLGVPLDAFTWWFAGTSPALGFAGIVVGQYLVFRQAAAASGRRLVTTVLAIKSAGS